MKKIILVTLQAANIGNRLQNYALQTVLESRNCEVVNPFCSENGIIFKAVKKIKSIIRFLLYLIGIKKYYLKEKKYKIIEQEKNTVNKDRNERFRKFDETYIHNMTDIFCCCTIKLKAQKFDLAITGSDQVWRRWSESKKELDFFYLTFAPKHKRAAYAASFGLSEIPNTDINIHKKGLTGLKYLSCREFSGAKIINDLTGRAAEILPDPTMLLSKNDWMKISRKPSYNIPKKYMLVYFLIKPGSDCEHTVNLIKKERGCEEINIHSTADQKHYITDPCEFLWLVEHADCICTDSFHACVFSIIFGARFLAFPQSKKNGSEAFNRIETLLFSYGLEDHIWQGENSPMLPVTEADNIPEKLKANARKGLDYIDMLLSDI